MALTSASPYISEAEYLEGEKLSEIKHEYIDGAVYAMAGTNREHNIIAGNIARKFGNQLEDGPCTTFIADLKVKAAGNFFYPDVFVTCGDENGDDYFTEVPVIIVEVLSRTTRRYDKTIKMRAYRTLPSLHAYVMVEQEYVDVEVCRRENGWVSEHHFLNDEIRFEPPNLTITVADIYRRIDNEEMRAYLQRQAAQTTQ